MTLTEKQKANLPLGLQKAILARMGQKNSRKLSKPIAKETPEEKANPSMAIMILSPQVKSPEREPSEKNYLAKKIVCPACGAKFNP